MFSDIFSFLAVAKCYIYHLFIIKHVSFSQAYQFWEYEVAHPYTWPVYLNLKWSISSSSGNQKNDIVFMEFDKVEIAFWLA